MIPAQATATAGPGAAGPRPGALFANYDARLIWLTLCMLGAGLVMMASASVTIAERGFQEPLYYFWRQLANCTLGLALGYGAMRLRLDLLRRWGLALLLLGILLLILILVPGLGREVNGSTRWLRLGPVSLQASEPMKLFMVIYLAGYLERRGRLVRQTMQGFFLPLVLLAVVCLLLLLEPDYGATAVLAATTLGMLFVGGVSVLRSLFWTAAAGAVMFTLAVLSPYRLQRMISFLDPWQDPFDQGFQLTQALIAFGRGGWFGEGLGGGLQKLFYLPEAHTDFVFAIIAEELGFLGSVATILAFYLLVSRCFAIAARAATAGRRFAAYLCYGFGLLLGIQTFVNIGVNTGLLPTKGLTLPLISYGGNSILVTLIAIGLVLRAGYESRLPCPERARP
ncbi:MAG: putative lipid II flippase FtsW [Gammaproteobacteria bacterium]|nr:putative lipid II flippase FtsW [Gammaproteobacteria bacterium]